MNGADDGDVALLGDRFQEGHHLGSAGGVDAGCGLVEEEDLRLLGEGEGDGEAALEATGQPTNELVAGTRVLMLGQPDLFEKRVDRLVPRPLAKVRLEQLEGEI